MSFEDSRITVGTNWITVCNGLWHGVFLEDGSALYPGPCRCDEDPSWYRAVVNEPDPAAERRASRRGGDNRRA